eukprot:gnl/MRDRNA2_/MRDRNA2_260471_c0_seq1.p1 gnl/MRDRNA2_/MRDRNA2_260471_c0~~gnl/MRDRNA2_/MRDRNA2_260471_c0_seq1.p1  ORF type:complete len:177 (+),score=12.82 gnl/MRDRNA2_/MRDRNA2_260471_c0_seq1:88-618(+)
MPVESSEYKDLQDLSQELQPLVSRARGLFNCQIVALLICWFVDPNFAAYETSWAWLASLVSLFGFVLFAYGNVLKCLDRTLRTESCLKPLALMLLLAITFNVVLALRTFGSALPLGMLILWIVLVLMQILSAITVILLILRADKVLGGSTLGRVGRTHGSGTTGGSNVTSRLLQTA